MVRPRPRGLEHDNESMKEWHMHHHENDKNMSQLTLDALDLINEISTDESGPPSLSLSHLRHEWIGQILSQNASSKGAA